MAKKRFPEKAWKEIASIISSSFSMDAGRSKRLLSNHTAKLIAALPYLAGCREPERTALAHLATFVVAGSGAGESVFDHKAGDDYDALARLATIGGFEGGDLAIIGKGMDNLAIMMIRGYMKDLQRDKDKGLYNPVGQGRWDAKAMLASLSCAAAAVRDEEMDLIVALGSEQRDWWQHF